MARVVVVTGASYGVGRATAEAFARRGDSVGLIARGEESLDATRAAVERLGGRALALSVDVADAAQVEHAAERIEAELGPIDIWVNNAMATIFAPLVQVTPDEFRRATEVTYLGTVWGTMAALRRMRPRARGAIVQVGSALAYRSIPLQAAYCGAKSAIRACTDSLRSELLHEGSSISLTMVQLPALNTPQFEVARSRLPQHPQPVPPIFAPEVAAEAIVWAAGAGRREVFVGWPTVRAILGQRFAPGFADRYLARVGYSAQQTDEHVGPERADSLFEPMPGVRHAHGPFGSQARSRSTQFQLTRSRNTIAVLIAAAAAAAYGTLSRR